MSRSNERMSEKLPGTHRRGLGWLQNSIGIAVLVGFGVYLWKRRDHFSSVLDVSAVDIVLLSVVTLATWLFASTQSWVLYRASRIRVGFWEAYLLTLATGIGNYLPARLGTIVRAHYLKSVHGLRYARFGSIQGIRIVIMVVATGVTGVSGTLGVAFGGGRLSLELLSIFTLLCVLPVFVWFWRPPADRGEAGRLRRILRDFVEGFAQLRARPGVSGAALVLVLLQYATLALRFAIAARAIGTDPPVAMLLLWAPLAALTSFAAVTPGGVGVREAVMGYATFATGAPFDHGLYVGTLDRAVLLAVLALIGGGSFVVIWVRIRRADRVGQPLTRGLPEPGVRTKPG